MLGTGGFCEFPQILSYNGERWHERGLGAWEKTDVRKEQKVLLVSL